MKASKQFTGWEEMLLAHVKEHKKPLITVLGPTASGKTDFSLRLCELIKKTSSDHGWEGAEIINADSRQFYKHLNIGTAKITEEEMRGVPHHLIDVLDPKEEVTIAWYKDKALEVIDEILERHHIPVLVGGSMLYVSAVVDGLEPLPVAPPEMRKKLEEAYDKDDGWELFDRLSKVDPKSAASFDRMNKQYVVRALELYEMTGRPPSELKKTLPPPYDILQFGLYWPREELTSRIDERARIMLRSGWVEEVEGLLDRGYTPSDPAMKSHGYKEIMAWLSSEDRDTETLAEAISSKTRQYAKRQMTWWGPDERIHWINISQNEEFVHPRMDGGSSPD